MANTGNVLKVLEAIRTPSNFVSMKQFWVDPVFLDCLTDEQFSKCYGSPKPVGTTPSCIAGWANHIAGNKLKDERAAAEFLGLAFPTESDALFRPRLARYKAAKFELSLISREEIIAALEHLVATGVVEWPEV
jgi:hypothetical protein|nr:hypothetical protein [Neorhizobium tomejilense]